MKIVTYNVNGLRQRISQFGSLLKLLNSFDADIICFQETKLRRQELTADLVMADGYESFFSCTRTTDKGRAGYSGVATFCRVNSAFSSNEVALPVAAEEGFTGLLGSSSIGKDEIRSVAEGLEEFAKGELLTVDNEGRCIITDHYHFVLFNIYGPRADSDDTERTEFKLKFYTILQKRWEFLLHQERRIFLVGDLNIAPMAIDRCDAGPDFEKNEFRRWFRSMLVESGGQFSDVFRAKHPDRREAYTCWSSSTGAEQFNYGSRIDHILCAGSCLHNEQDMQSHNLVACHVTECDILTQYKRWRPGNALRWKGGWSTKLEGSDHAPVYTTLVEIPDVCQHSTPSLAARYLPMIHGLQQTLVSVLMRRQVRKQVDSMGLLGSSSVEDVIIESCSDSLKRSLSNYAASAISPGESCSLEQGPESTVPKTDGRSTDVNNEAACSPSITLGNEHFNGVKKKARKNQWSQLSLRSFFQQSPNLSSGIDISATDISLTQENIPNSNRQSDERPTLDDLGSRRAHNDCNPSSSTQGQDAPCSLEDKNNVALAEWRRIQGLMQNSIPLCKGHKERCVARVVKKPGPTFGRRFYVCGRAEGPSSNPEANCGYFKWASSKSQQK